MENVEFRIHIKEKQELNNIDSQIQKKHKMSTYHVIFTTDERGTKGWSVVLEHIIGENKYSEPQ